MTAPQKDQPTGARPSLFREEAISKYERPLASTTPAMLPVAHRGLLVMAICIALAALAIWCGD